MKRALSGRAYGFGSFYAGYFPYADGDGVAEDSYERLSNGRLGADVQLRWDPTPAHRIVAGVDGQWDGLLRYRLWDDEITYTRFDAPFGVVSVYAQDEFQALPELALTLGLRHDRSSSTGGVTSPRAAAVFTPTARTSVKALYGEAFRAATPFERLYADPLAGFEANPALAPERVATAELALEHGFGRALAVTAGVFRYRVRRLIEAAYTPDSLVTHVNRGRVTAHGLTAGATLRPSARAEVRAGYTWQHATAGHDGDPETARLVNSPEHVLNLRATYGLARGWALAYEGRAESGRQTFTGDRTRPFVLHHATLSGPATDALRLTLGVRNVLGTRYSYPGGAHLVQAGVEQDRRTGFVNLSLRL